MISQNAKNSVDMVLNHALLESIKNCDKYNTWDIKTIKDADEIKEKEFMMLTISSSVFRIFVLLHFTQNEQTKDFVASALRLAANNIEEGKYYDYLSEVGNVFCGAVKRELSRHTTYYMGMSTPNQLDLNSLVYVDEMKPDYAVHVKAEHKSGAVICGSLYIAARTEIDFKIPETVFEDKSDMGALELF